MRMRFWLRSVLVWHLPPVRAASTVFTEPTSYIVYDAPAYSPGQVVFQVNTVGTLPDHDAVLYYRETPGGELFGPIPYTNIGFMMGAEAGDDYNQGIMAWEWDLSAYTVAEYYIDFGSSSASMSLWWANLHTWDDFSAELANALFLVAKSNYGTAGEVRSYDPDDGNANLSYEDGDEVAITAEAKEGWAFVCWTGDIYSENATTAITVNGNMDVTAVFAPKNYDTWAKDAIQPNSMREEGDEGDFASNSASTADPNRNGLNNILEYAFGGTPEFVSDPDALPVPGLSEDGKHLTLTYRRQPKATDLEYRVVVSSDMETWIYNGDGTAVTYTSEDISTTYNEDGTQTVVVTDQTDLSTLPEGSVRQMRLQIILN